MYRWGKLPAVGSVLALALAAGGCEWAFYETTYKLHIRATIRVAGEDYLSEVVTAGYRRRIFNNYVQDPHGRVLSFRLKDNRVLIIPSRFGVLWWCAHRLDGASSDCSASEMKEFQSRRGADGFIFDDADSPGTATAFQVEPRADGFSSLASFRTRDGADFRIEGSSVELVGYEITPSLLAGPRDSLEGNFPGYKMVWGAQKSMLSSEIRVAALRILLPGPQER